MLNPANDGISQAYVERAYYYDSKDRVVQAVERNHLGGISRTSVKYDFVGNILAQCESHQTEAGDTPPDTKTTRFGYDYRSRLQSEKTILNDGSRELSPMPMTSWGGFVVRLMVIRINPDSLQCAGFRSEPISGVGHSK